MVEYCTNMYTNQTLYLLSTCPLTTNNTFSPFLCTHVPRRTEFNSEYTSDLLPIGPLLPPRTNPLSPEPSSQDSKGGVPSSESANEEAKTFFIDKGVCLKSTNMFNETLCRQLDRRVRTFTCTDISPIDAIECSLPYIIDRCDSIWMWKEAFCLKSCDRCGDEGCIDIPPPGVSSCDSSHCDSPEYLKDGSPYCLATCRRCSFTHVEWLYYQLVSWIRYTVLICLHCK